MYVWCKHSAAEVHTNTRMGEADAPTLLLDTARRMRVAGQICLRDVEKPFTVTAVEIGNLPAGVTAAYHHVENMIYHDGVPYPDKLSLATSVTVRINVTHVIWVLIDVDETAEAGLYRIPVTLRTDTGDQAVSFTLRIYPVILPLPSDPGTFGHEYFFDAFSFAPKQPAPIKAPCEPFYALTDAQSAANLLGNDDSAEIVHSSDNSCCFHICILLTIFVCRTIPVAVPGIFVGGGAPASSADRCHSLSSLYPPPAALASLPCCFHISSLLVNVELRCYYL